MKISLSCWSGRRPVGKGAVLSRVSGGIGIFLADLNEQMLAVKRPGEVFTVPGVKIAVPGREITVPGKIWPSRGSGAHEEQECRSPGYSTGSFEFPAESQNTSCLLLIR